MSYWLTEILRPRGWHVKWLDTGGVKNCYDSLVDHDNSLEGVVFIYGNNDVDSCNIACSIVENHPEWCWNPKTNLVILLEDPLTYYAAHGLLQKYVIECAVSSNNVETKKENGSTR